MDTITPTRTATATAANLQEGAKTRYYLLAFQRRFDAQIVRVDGTFPRASGTYLRGCRFKVQ